LGLLVNLYSEIAR